MNIFEYATKNKVRFEYKGLISVEELWDLRVIELDKIYKTLIKQKKESGEESLLSVQSEDKTLNNKIDIIKYIVAFKQNEATVRELAKANADKKQKIAEILHDKKNEALKNLSVEELEKLLSE